MLYFNILLKDKRCSCKSFTLVTCSTWLFAVAQCLVQFVLFVKWWWFLFHLNVNLISPSQPRASVLPSFSQTLHHNQTFVCILAHIHLTGCSWMLFSDWTLCVNRRSLKLESIYEVSLDSNETLINNIISKTGCLLGCDSCKKWTPIVWQRAGLSRWTAPAWTVSSWSRVCVWSSSCPQLSHRAWRGFTFLLWAIRPGQISVWQVCCYLWKFATCKYSGLTSLYIWFCHNGREHPVGDGCGW